jgi:hypothetical protein
MIRISGSSATNQRLTIGMPGDGGLLAFGFGIIVIPAKSVMQPVMVGSVEVFTCPAGIGMGWP